MVAVDPFTLQLSSSIDGTQTLQITSSGAYNFPTPLTNGASFSGSVSIQPLTSSVTLFGNTGVIAGANVNDFNVVITADPTVAQFNTKASYFKATDNQVATGSFDANALFDLGGASTTFSISFWAKSSGTLPNIHDVDGTEGNYPFVGVSNNGAAPGSRYYSWALAPRAAVGEVLYFEWNNLGDTPNGFTNRLNNRAPTVNWWNHYLLVYDGPNNKCEGYINGVLWEGPDAIVGSVGSALATSSAPFRVNGGQDPGTYRNCYYDEMGVYNTALTESDAKDHFNKGSPKSLLNASGNANLQAYWRFGDNDTSPIIEDKTGNGYDLRYVNVDSPNDSGSLTGSFQTATLPTDFVNDVNLSFIGDGADDYFNVAHESFQDFSANEAFSVVFWASASWGTDVNNVLLGKGTVSGQAEVFQSLNRLGGVDLYVSGTRFQTPVVPADGWVQLAFVYASGTNGGYPTIYYDAVSQSVNLISGDIPGTLPSGSDSTLSFLARGNGTVGLPGALYKVGVWNRALTESEVSGCYNSGNAGVNWKDVAGNGLNYYFVGSSFVDTDTEIINYGSGSNATPQSGIVTSEVTP